MTRVLFLADAGATIGVGHATRVIALAEEFKRQGWSCHLQVDTDWSPLLRALVDGLGVQSAAPLEQESELATVCSTLGIQVVVVDSYRLPAGFGGELRQNGQLVVAIVDQDAREIDADLYIDHNLGVSSLRNCAFDDRRQLLGSKYTIVKDTVLDWRPAAPPVHVEKAPLQILAFFGGSDPYLAAPRMVEALAALEPSVQVTVVASNEIAKQVLEEKVTSWKGNLDVIDPTPDIGSYIVQADIVVSAAGTSLWEVYCLGACSAIVAVVDNQFETYETVTSDELSIGLGTFAQGGFTEQFARDQLAMLAKDTELRSRLSSRTWKAVDGLGKVRIVDEINALISQANSKVVN